MPTSKYVNYVITVSIKAAAQAAVAIEDASIFL